MMSMDTFLSTPPSRVATGLHAMGVQRAEAFLSTPPSRVATQRLRIFDLALQVSIHATLAGGDDDQPILCRLLPVSIHATLAGGDPGRRL